LVSNEKEKKEVMADFRTNREKAFYEEWYDKLDLSFSM